MEEVSYASNLNYEPLDNEETENFEDMESLGRTSSDRWVIWDLERLNFSKIGRI